MSERKPSERWQRIECGCELRFGPIVVNVIAYTHDRHYVWSIEHVDPYCDGDICSGEAESAVDAQLAAEDALLSIAREIREAVGRE